MIEPGYSSQARTSRNLWIKMEALLPCTSEVCIQLWFSVTPERIKLHVGQLSRYCTCCLAPSLPFHSQFFHWSSLSTSLAFPPCTHSNLTLPHSNSALIHLSLLSPEWPDACVTWVSMHSAPRTLNFISPLNSSDPPAWDKISPGQTVHTN